MRTQSCNFLKCITIKKVLEDRFFFCCGDGLTSYLEQSTAADFIDRALFTYERAFSGAFSLTSGTNRLDFDRVENRPFFLAVHRKIT